MPDTDVQKQWGNLVEAYAGMSEGELTSLAEQAYELTDLARQALQAEIKARSLHVELAETASNPPERAQEEAQGDLDPAELDLLPVGRVWDASEAQGLMKTLYEAGVPAYLGPEYAESVDDFRGNFEAGIDVQVRTVDHQRALAALAAASPKTDDDTEDEPSVVVCPACKSDEVVFEELVAAASAADSAPSQKFRWRCDACGHEWEDDGIEE
jgi:DNA-directed RNA polymerase subunit M/transcription elongation factor TFIIS